jgi:hypothetical protein
MFLAIVLMPLFSEIKIFGLSFKREIEDAKKDIKSYITELKYEIKNNNNVNIQPNIYVSNVEQAKQAEFDDKIKKEEVEVEKKEKITFTLENIAKQNEVILNEKITERIEMIKNIEFLIFKKLAAKYGDDFQAQVKIQNNLGKNMIFDGVLYHNAKIVEFIEVKLVSYKSFENFKYIIGRWLKKYIGFGLKIPIRIILASKDLDQETALKIKNDLKFINMIKRFDSSSVIPQVNYEFIKIENNEIIEIYP